MSSGHAGTLDFLLDATGPDEVETVGSLRPEQEMIVESAREFMEGEVAARRDELEGGDPAVMEALLERAADVGLTGIGIPERFGGVELDLPTGMLVAREMARDLSFSLSLASHIGIGTFPLVIFGTETQKERYLPDLVDADRIGAYALTEPEGGSDALHPSTTATPRDGGGFRLNGRKRYITNVQIAGLFTVFADIEGEGFSALLLPAEAEGIEAGPPEAKMGRKGSPTGDLVFDDADIPDDHVVGEEGRGHVVALNTLNIARIKLGYGAVGGIEELVETSASYAANRKQFDQSIGDFELIRTKLADMAVRRFLLEGICEHVVHEMDGRLPDDLDAADPEDCVEVLEDYAVTSALIKVYGSEALDFAADEAVQIHGGAGYMEDYEVCRIYRDVRSDRIFEGTNEVNRLLAARNIFKAGMAGDLELPELLRLGRGDPPADSATASELAEMLRWLFARCIGAAVEGLDSDPEDEQDVAAGLVDLVTELFALDTAAARGEAGAGGPIGEALLTYATEHVRSRVLPIAVRLASRLELSDVGEVAAALSDGASDVSRARDRIAERYLDRAET